MKEVFWHPQIGFTMRHLLPDELFESLMDCSVTLCTLMQQCQANRSCKALTFRMEDFFHCYPSWPKIWVKLMKALKACLWTVAIVVAKPKRCRREKWYFVQDVLRGQGSKANEFLSFYSCALLPMAPARAALLKQWRKGDRLSRFWYNDLCNLYRMVGVCNSYSSANTKLNYSYCFS